MFRIKICGVTNVDDALAAAAAGADAIGLNFYANSPRCVSHEAAAQIVSALPSGIKKVGVFVNANADEIRGLSADLPLDLIQLHGDEEPAFLAGLIGTPAMRAFRPVGSLEGIQAYLDKCDRLNCRPEMVLIDAFRKTAYGGTGETADWDAIRTSRSLLRGLPIVLAGGLTAENVAKAIAAVEPDGVDSASGVELSPGRKSPDLIRAFVAQAKRAFDLLDQSR